MPGGRGRDRPLAVPSVPAERIGKDTRRHGGANVAPEDAAIAALRANLG